MRIYWIACLSLLRNKPIKKRFSLPRGDVNPLIFDLRAVSLVVKLGGFTSPRGGVYFTSWGGLLHF